MRRTAGILASASVLVLALAAPAAAKRIVVTSPADAFNEAPETCALREAIQSAQTNTNFGGCVRTGKGRKDPVILEGGDSYTRSISGAYEDENATGDLDVTGKVTIKVNGTGRATIDAVDIDRGLEVLPGGKLTASRLIIRDGELPNSSTSPGGGGIRVADGAKLVLSSSQLYSNEALGNGGCSCGGGIATSGKTTLSRASLDQNSADHIGGGIAFLTGSLSVSRSTIATNSSYSRGGGIYLGGGADDSVTLARSTLSGNLALIAAGGIYLSAFGGPTYTGTNLTISDNHAYEDGGGIWTNSGDLRLNATTITANSADYDENGSGDGGGINGGDVSFKNSIVAGNDDPLATSNRDCDDVGGATTSHNLIEPNEGCVEGGSNVVAPDPMLGLLAPNGGPTETHELLAGSPAINKAGRGSAPSTDQRGRNRGRKPDIGAYER